MPDSLADQPASVRTKRSRKDRPCDHCRRLRHTCKIAVRGTPCENCVRGKRQCTFDGPAIQRHPNSVAGPSRQRSSREPSRQPAGPSQTRSRSATARLADALDEIERDSETSDHEVSRLCRAVSQRAYTQAYFHDLDQDLQDEEESHYLGSGLFARQPDVDIGPVYRQVADADRPVYFLRNPSRVYGYANADFEAQRAYNSVMALVLQKGPMLPATVTEAFSRHVLPTFPIMNAVRLEAACKGWQGGGPFPYALLVGAFAFMSPTIPALRPLCKELWSHVVQLLDNEYRRPRLHTLQLALLDIAGRPVLNSGGNHVAIGRAHGLVQLLGLHRDCSQWKLPQWERSLRKRIWWTLFVQDRWNALVYDRPVQINRALWDGQEVTLRDDDWGGSNPECDISAFVLECRLACILDDILPAVQAASIAIIPADRLRAVTRDLDHLGEELANTKAVGHGPLWISYIGILSLLVRLVSLRNSDRSVIAGARRAVKAMPSAVKHIEQISESIKALETMEMDGYWPIWVSPLLAMSVSTALHLAGRVHGSTSTHDLMPVFSAISALLDLLAPLAKLSPSLSLTGSSDGHYWEVAESCMPRLLSIVRSLPDIPGSERLRAFAAAQSPPVIDPASSTFDPLEWANWLAWPDTDFGSAGVSSSDLFGS